MGRLNSARRMVLTVALLVIGHILTWWACTLLVENLAATGRIGLGEFSLADQATQKIIGSVSIAAPLAFTVLMLAAFGIRPRVSFDIRRVPLSLIGFALLATPGAFLLGAANWLDLWEFPSIAAFGDAAAAWIALVLATMVIGVVVEEMTFRGILLTAVQDATQSRLLTISITAVVFSLFHSQWDWGSLVARFLLGASLAWATCRIGGIEFGIGAHLAINLTYLLLDPSFDSDRVLVSQATVAARHAVDSSLNQIEGAAFYGLLILGGSTIISRTKRMGTIAAVNDSEPQT